MPLIFSSHLLLSPSHLFEPSKSAGLLRYRTTPCITMLHVSRTISFAPIQVPQSFLPPSLFSFSSLGIVWTPLSPINPRPCTYLNSVSSPSHLSHPRSSSALPRLSSPHHPIYPHPHTTSPHLTRCIIPTPNTPSPCTTLLPSPALSLPHSHSTLPQEGVNRERQRLRVAAQDMT